MSARQGLTKAQKTIGGGVAGGALIIAAIGFTGSYSAVRALAERKGLGDFATAFPIGIDAGIAVLLALDLLLTWIRIPFPLLRQTAWLLTAATIAFNGAAAWPDPLGVGMHAVIPVLFVVTVEAARHAVGRIADITADKHMEGVRITRWLLSPLPTFLLWRRMKLWELRSYEQTIRLEQERLTYQARLHSRYGRGWRRKAPVESLMPLRLARYGVPLAETAPAGLAAAGLEPALASVTAPSTSPAAIPPPSPTAAEQTPTQSTPEEHLAAVHAAIRDLNGFPSREQVDMYLRGERIVADRAPAATPAARNATSATLQRQYPATPATSAHATPEPRNATPATQSPRNATPEAATPDSRNAATTEHRNATPEAGNATQGSATPEHRNATPEAATPAEHAAREVVEEAARTVAADLDGVTLLTTAQVAELKGVTQGTVRSWVKRGHLTPALRDANGRNHFHPAAVADLD